MIEQTYYLDMIPSESVPPVVHVSQYDNNTRTLIFNLMKGGVAYEVPDGFSATCDGIKPDGTVFSYAMTVSGNSVSVDVVTQMAAVAGDVICEVVCADSTGQIGSANFILAVEECAIDSGEISESDIAVFEELRTETLQAAAEAAESASTAETAASSVSAILPASTGTTGQVLTKTDDGADWADASGGGTWGSITGTISDQTDLQTELDAKQDTLTFDTTPTSDSTNPVTSGGVYDALADKADASDVDTLTANLATVETSSTASQAYDEGDLLVYNGVLYTASTSIASGGTLAVGTNLTATTVGDELAAVNDDINSIGTVEDYSANTGHVTIGTVLIQWGYVNVTPSAANTPTAEWVSFDETFTAEPSVSMTVNSSVVGSTVLGCGATAVKTTGFNAYVLRANTTTTGIFWIAVGRKV